MLSNVASHLSGETNSLYLMRAELESRGHVVTDLISSNVNPHGIFFPQELLEDILVRSARQSRVYQPDSFGHIKARQAISGYYDALGENVPPTSIVLTPGTSIAFWYCFKLLANDGDEILCPRPSYPLFDYIATLSGVKLVNYDLDEARDWAINLEHLESQISTRTRAIVLISPHNPTGHVATAVEIQGLIDIAARHQLTIVSDEVFSEFTSTPGRIPRALRNEGPLVITLNGFSKMFALPGLKLGWMALSGAPEKVEPALRALEMISDTFLPVSEIAQGSVPDILSTRDTFCSSYSGEIQKRWNIARAALTDCRRVDFVEPKGGFYLTLKLKDLDEDDVAHALLESAHLLVHPGYFYEMDSNHLVMSFVQEPEIVHRAFSLLSSTLNALP